MTALVEVHDEDEVDRAVDAGAAVIGVNARDLRTLEVDRAVFARLRPLIPDDVVKHRRVRRPRPARRPGVARRGADAVLVGEALVTVGTRAERSPTSSAAAPRHRPGPARSDGSRRMHPAIRQVRRPVRPRGAHRRARPARRGPPQGDGRPGVRRRARAAAPHLHRAAEHHHRGAAVRRARRRRPDHPQARGPQPHRLAQDQQRARPGPADQADGQDARHRRDRRRPARRRDGDRGRAVRARVHRLHGQGGHRAAGPQRRPHAAARRRGRPGHHRQPDPQGRRSTRPCATGSPTSTTPTTSSAPSSARTPSPRWSATSSGSSAIEARAQVLELVGRLPGRRRSPASAAVPTRWASSTGSSTTAASRLVGLEAGGDGHGHRTARRPVRGRHPGVLHGAVLLRHAGRRRPDRRHPLRLRRPGLPRASARSTPGCTTAGARTYRAVTDERGHGGVPAAVPDRGDHPRHRVQPRAGRRDRGRRASSGRDAVLVVNLSGRGDKDVDTAAALVRAARRRGAPEEPHAKGIGSRRERPPPSRRTATRAGPRWSGYLPVGSPTSPPRSRPCARWSRRGVDIVEVGRAVQRPRHGRSGRPARRRRALARAAGSRRLRAVEPSAPRPGSGHDLLEPVVRYGVDASRATSRRPAAPGSSRRTSSRTRRPWIAASDAHGLDRVFLVAPSSTPERLGRDRRQPRVRLRRLHDGRHRRPRDGRHARESLVARTRAVTDLPVCVGLGVSTASRRPRSAAFADGVIVGSALVRTLVDAADAEEGIGRLPDLAADLAAGVRRSRERVATR